MFLFWCSINGSLRSAVLTCGHWEIVAPFPRRYDTVAPSILADSTYGPFPTCIPILAFVAFEADIF